MNVVNNNEDFRAAHVCERTIMWQSVILGALSDTRTTNMQKDFQLNKRRAIAWFEGGGADFREVCSLAGLDPDWVRDNFMRGKIDFDALHRKPGREQ